MAEAMLQQLRAILPEESGTSEVDFGDLAFVCECQVANRGEFVEIRIAVAGFLQRGLRAAQLLVLHLQFNLVHPEFVQQFLRRARHQLYIRRVHELRLGNFSQLVLLVWLLTQGTSLAEVRFPVLV